MGRKCSEEQIMSAFDVAEVEAPIVELLREAEINERSF